MWQSLVSVMAAAGMLRGHAQGGPDGLGVVLLERHGELSEDACVCSVDVVSAVVWLLRRCLMYCRAWSPILPCASKTKGVMVVCLYLWRL